MRCIMYIIVCPIALSVLPFRASDFTFGILSTSTYENEQKTLTPTSNGSSEAVNGRKTDNAMAKRKKTTALRNTAQKTKA